MTELNVIKLEQRILKELPAESYGNFIVIHYNGKVIGITKFKNEQGQYYLETQGPIGEVEFKLLKKIPYIHSKSCGVIETFQDILNCIYKTT